MLPTLLCPLCEKAWPSRGEKRKEHLRRCIEWHCTTDDQKSSNRIPNRSHRHLTTPGKTRPMRELSSSPEILLGKLPHLKRTVFEDVNSVQQAIFGRQGLHFSPKSETKNRGDEISKSTFFTSSSSVKSAGRVPPSVNISSAPKQASLIAFGFSRTPASTLLSLSQLSTTYSASIRSPSIEELADMPEGRLSSVSTDAWDEIDVDLSLHRSYLGSSSP